MAQFVLKIEKLSHITGLRGSQDLQSPSPIMAPAWILLVDPPSGPLSGPPGPPSGPPSRPLNFFSEKKLIINLSYA